MRTATRAVLLSACVSIAGAGPARSLVVAASVEPGTVVPIGTVITLTMTLTADRPGPNGLGHLKADPALQSVGCMGPSAPYDGWYSVYPDRPELVVDGVPGTASLNFNQGSAGPLWVQWQFTATRTGTVSFSAVAADFTVSPNVFEGCADPSPITTYPYRQCNMDTTGFPYGPSSCAFATVTITSTLTGHLSARSTGAGGRPDRIAYIEDPVEVVFSLTNTGTDPLTLGYAGASTAFTGTSVILSEFASPSGPLPTLGAGASAMLTWSYSVTAVSPSGTAWFWADADGTRASAGGLLVVPAPITLTVTIWTDPDGAGPLPDVPVDSGWLNAGDEIRVVATLQNASAGSFEVDPRITAADTPGSGAGPDFAPVGGRIPAAPQTLAPFTSRAFEWRYTIDRNDFYWIMCQVGCIDMSWDVRVRGVAQTVFLPVRDGGFSVTPEIPPVVQIGTEFSGTLWVTNLTGRPVVLDASATVFLQAAGAVRVTVTGVPVPGNRSFTAAGESQPFVFTATADSVGTQSWYGGIACYWDPSIYACTGMTSPATTEIVAPCPLIATMLSSTTILNSTMPFGLRLGLFNSATCLSTLTGLSDIRPSPSTPILGNDWYAFPESADCPSLPCGIAAGATAWFSWSATPYGCGDEDWSGSITGDWDASCLFPTAFSRPFRSNRVVVRQQASLYDPGSVSWAVSRTQVVESGDFEVVCSVVPGSQNDIENFSLAIAPHFSSTSTAISLLSAPTIPSFLPGCGACVTNVCPEKSRSFTWRFRADDRGAYAGRVWFTFTASGRDPYDLTPVSSVTTTGAVRIMRPSTITASAMNDPSLFGPCLGTVQLVVQVEGDTPVLVHSVGVNPSAPIAWVSSEPDICCSVTISGNSLAVFNWTWSSVGEGSVSFTASASGIETELGAHSYAVASTADSRTVTGAALGGWLGAFPAAPVAGSGTPFAITFTTTNFGQVRADNVWVQAWSVTGTAACGGRPAVAPMLASTLFSDTSLGLYGCVSPRAGFAWYFTTTPGGEGDIEFAVTITGIKSDLGIPLTVTDRFCVTLYPPVYANIVSVPEYVIAGGDFDVGISIVNQGAPTVKVTPGFPVVLSASGDIVEVGGVPPPVTVGPYSTGTITARMTVRRGANPGPDRLSVSAAQLSARDMSTKAMVGVPVNAGPSVTVNVLPDKMSFEIGENPWHPLRGPLAIRYVAPDGGRVTIRAYNLAGELVRTILDEKNAVLRGTVPWDGRNEDDQPVAAGIYLLRFEGTGLKVTKKLAVVK